MPLTNAGYLKRTADEIKSDLAAKAEIQSPGFSQFTADVANNLLDMSTVGLLELENLVAEFLNGYAPGYANNFIKKALANSLGLDLKSETKSSVTLLFKGDPGVYIPKDLELNEGFKTSSSAVLDSTGSAYILAYSENTSTFAAGQINKINNSPDDSLTVTNPSASIPYVAAETIDELWSRSQKKLRNACVGNTDYTTGLLLGIAGIVENRINFNFITTDTKRGIEAIVLGGEPHLVAEALFNGFLDLQNFQSNPSDSDNSRTISYNLIYGTNSIPIIWTTPKNINLSIEVDLSFKYISVYSGNMQIILENLFKNEINNRKVGMPLNKHNLDNLIYEAVQNMSIPLQYLATINYSFKDSDTQAILNFDTQGYLSAIQKDIYLTMTEFKLEIITS